MSLIFRYDQLFIPPVHNPVVVGLAKLSVPVVLNMSKLRISPTVNCVRTVTAANSAHTVLIPNHSDQDDPVLVFALSKICEESFYYISARELFDKDFGLRGLFLQNCGAYSVIRGEPDYNYIRATISLLVHGNRKLVMFAEGDVTGLQFRTIPLRNDGIELLFMSQAKLMERAFSQELTAIPIAVYYQATTDVIPALRDTAARLEAAIGLSQKPNDNLEARTNRLIRALISHLEIFYGCQVSDRVPLPEQINLLCRCAINDLAALAGVSVSAISDDADALHKVRFNFRTAPKRKLHCRCSYCQKLRTELISHDQLFFKDFERLQQLLILSRTLEQAFTPLVAWRVIDRLEKEITGIPTSKGHRTAWIDAGSPVNLADYWSSYTQNKHAAIAQVASSMRHSIETTLQDLAQRVDPNAARQTLAAREEVSSR